jgi:hypothetical protein
MIIIVSAASLLVPFTHSLSATKLVSFGDRFVITRDFLSNVITEPKDARVRIDSIKLVTPTENTEWHAFAEGILAKYVSVVQTKEAANYDLLLIFQDFDNPAIRNKNNAPTTATSLLDSADFLLKRRKTIAESSPITTSALTRGSTIFARPSCSG